MKRRLMPCSLIESPESYSDCWASPGEERAELRGDKRLLQGGLPFGFLRIQTIYPFSSSKPPRVGVKDCRWGWEVELARDCVAWVNMYQKNVIHCWVPCGDQGEDAFESAWAYLCLGEILGIETLTSRHLPTPTKSIDSELVQPGWKAIKS